MLVEGFKMGPVAPFDAAAVVLTVGGLIIASSWTENFGNASEHTSVAEGFKKAGTLIWNGGRGTGWVRRCRTGPPAGGAPLPADSVPRCFLEPATGMPRPGRASRSCRAATAERRCCRAPLAPAP